MRDRVGEAPVPTEAQVRELIADIAGIQKRIDAFTTILSNTERQAAPKMRLGGERIVARLAHLAQRHEVALPVVSVARMTARLTLAQRLRPLVASSRQLTRRLEDTVIDAQGECWWLATALYSTLGRLAAGSADLQVALRPVVAFFARRKRKKAIAASAPSTPSSSAA